MLTVRGCGAGVLVVAVCLGTAVPRAEQKPSAEFLKLLEQYRAGESDVAVRTLSRWTEARVRRETMLGEEQSDPALRLAAAVFLTEAGLSAGVFGRLGEDNGLEVNLGSWGIEKPFEPFSFHAYRLIEQIAKDAKRDGDLERLALARSWFVVAASQCEFADEFCAEGLLQRAGYLFGNDDAEYLLLEGSIRQQTKLNRTRVECINLPPQQCTPIPWLDAGSTPGRITRAQVQGWWFKKALEIDPMLVEARARLGRVRSVFLNEPDAIPEFERAYADARTIGHDFAAYLAALFLGEHLELNGDLEGAAVWYAKAVEVRPAYTASIALGQALIRLGKRDEGFAAGRAMFEGQGRGGDPLPDPAIQYHYGLYWQMEDRLRVLRARAR